MLWNSYPELCLYLSCIYCLVIGFLCGFIIAKKRYKYMNNFCMVADLPPYSKFSFTEKGQLLILGEYDDDVDRFAYHIQDNPAKKGFVRADLHVFYRG